MATQPGRTEAVDIGPGRIVLLCAALLFVSGFALQSLSFALPALERAWALDTRMLGVLLSATMLGQMAGYLVLAPLADALGPRWPAAAGCLALAAMLALSAMATSVEIMLVTRALTGLAIGAAIPAAVAAASTAGSARWQAGRVIIVYTAFPLGFVAVAIVNGSIVTPLQWRTTFVLGAACALLLAPWLWHTLPRRRAAVTHPAPFAAVTAVLRDDRTVTMLLWGVFSVGLGLFYVLQGWMPVLIQRAGQPFETAAMATAMFGIGASLAAVPAIVATRYIGLLPALIAVGVLTLLGIVALALSLDAGNAALIVATALIAGTGVGGIQKVAVATATSLYPAAARATGLALALGVGRISAVCSPVLIGLAASALLPGSTILLLAVPVAAMVAALAWFRRHRDPCGI